jgi:DNA-binding IscR family transcriptional regulator
MQPVHHVLKLMLDAGFLSETSDEPPAYLPRQDVDTIRLADLYEVVRSAGESRFLALNSLPHQAQVDAAMAATQRAIEAEFGEQTLKDLVKGG